MWRIGILAALSAASASGSTVSATTQTLQPPCFIVDEAIDDVDAAVADGCLHHAHAAVRVGRHVVEAVDDQVGVGLG